MEFQEKRFQQDKCGLKKEERKGKPMQVSDMFFQEVTNPILTSI